MNEEENMNYWKVSVTFSDHGFIVATTDGGEEDAKVMATEYLAKRGAKDIVIGSVTLIDDPGELDLIKNTDWANELDKGNLH